MSDLPKSEWDEAFSKLRRLQEQNDVLRHQLNACINGAKDKEYLLGLVRKQRDQVLRLLMDMWSAAQEGVVPSKELLDDINTLITRYKDRVWDRE